MISKFLAGAAVMAGAIVTASIITEIQKNENIKAAGREFFEGAKKLGSEVCKSAANATRASVAGVKEKMHEASVEEVDLNDVYNDASEDEILSSDKGDITVCAEGIKDIDNISRDQFEDADTELSADEIIDNSSEA